MLTQHRVPQIMSKLVWKKNEYPLEHSHQPEDIRRVMIIYSGGTLGMKWRDKQGEYGAGQLAVCVSMIGVARHI